MWSHTFYILVKLYLTMIIFVWLSFYFNNRKDILVYIWIFNIWIGIVSILWDSFSIPIKIFIYYPTLFIVCQVNSTGHFWIHIFLVYSSFLKVKRTKERKGWEHRNHSYFNWEIISLLGNLRFTHLGKSRKKRKWKKRKLTKILTSQSIW